MQSPCIIKKPQQNAQSGNVSVEYVMLILVALGALIIFTRLADKTLVELFTEALRNQLLIHTLILRLPI